MGLRSHRSRVDKHPAPAAPARRARRTAGDHRAHQRTGRGPAARSRPPRRTGASDIVLRRSSSLERLRREIRPRRQLQAGRLPAHRRASAAPTGADRTRAARTAGVGRLRDDQVRPDATVNQLTATLDAHWPGPRNLFRSLASAIALAFLTDYPTPQAAAHLGEARMAAFCRRHSYRGGKSQQSCSPGCAPPHRSDRIARRHSRRHHRRPGRPAAALQSTIATTEKSSPNESPRTRAPGCSNSCPASASSTSLSCSPRSAHPRSRRLRRTGRHRMRRCAGHQGSGKSSGVYFRWAANTRARKAITRSPTTPECNRPGPASSTPTPGTRQTQPARHPHRRPRLDPRHLGLLAQRHPYDPTLDRRRSSSQPREVDSGD